MSITVTDPTDLGVLIPATRRAIDGPMAIASGSVAATLSDVEVYNLIADAAGDLILQTVGSPAFGYQLIVTERDPNYLSPIAWATDKVRDVATDAAIVCQSALNHFFWIAKLMKMSETIADESQTWTYAYSPSVVSGWMQYLISMRDRAIQSLIGMNVPLDTYFSTVAERDLMAATWLEPWVSEIGAPVPFSGGGGSGPVIIDARFGTFG